MLKNNKVRIVIFVLILIIAAVSFLLIPKEIEKSESNRYQLNATNVYDDLNEFVVAATEAKKSIQSKINKELRLQKDSVKSHDELKKKASQIAKYEFSLYPEVQIDITSQIQAPEFLEFFESLTSSPTSSETNQVRFRGMSFQTHSALSKCTFSSNSNYSFVYFKYKDLFYCITYSELGNKIDMINNFSINSKDLDIAFKDIETHGGLSIEILKEFQSYGPGVLGILRYINGDANASIEQLNNLTKKQRIQFLALSKLSGNTQELLELFDTSHKTLFKAITNASIGYYFFEKNQSKIRLSQEGLNPLHNLLFSRDRWRALEGIELAIKNDWVGAELAFKAIGDSDILQIIKNISADKITNIYEGERRLNIFLMRSRSISDLWLTDSK